MSVDKMSAEPQEPTSSTSMKRRASNETAQEAKKQRTSSGKSSPKSEDEELRRSATIEAGCTPEQSLSATHESKKKSTVDERQRSKRLFGTLFGNVNPAGDRVTKRRTEIEQRRKAELQKQDDERNEDRQKRLAKLAIHRKRQQVHVDEENMHVRHKNMLNEAQSLKTNAEPRLFYRPWDLRAEEEDIIADQISETQARVDSEVAEFEIEKERRLKNEDGPLIGGSQDEERPNDDDVSSVKVKQRSSAEERSHGDTEHEKMHLDEQHSQERAQVLEADNLDAEGSPARIPDDEAQMANDSASKESKQHQKDEIDDEGDHVMEGDEDTVIY